jgi:hypothetical protein
LPGSGAAAEIIAESLWQMNAFFQKSLILGKIKRGKDF